MGSVGKIKESVAPYSLEARMEAHKLAPELKEVQLKLIDLGNTKKKLSKLKDVTAGEAALKKVMVRLGASMWQIHASSGADLILRASNQ